MPLRTVTFIKDSFYHVYNRGSEKRIIFLTERDYNNFLDRVKEGLKKYSFALHSFCLLPNHFHFLIKQKSDVSLARFMNALLLGYAKYFNTKYERIGPLFQGRFKAKLINSDEYLLQLSKYIHRNPLSNSRNPKNSRNLLSSYRYSSFPNYLGVNVWPFVETEEVSSYFSKTNPKLSYKNFIEDNEADLEMIAQLILE